jgi:ERF superfamily
MTEPTILHPHVLAPQSETRALLNMIERVARDTSVDMTVLERLMAMRERVVADERRMAFNEAIGKAKADMPEIKKNNTVNFGNGKAAYQYEDLAEIERTIKKTLSTHGLSYRWRTDSVSKPGTVIVTCIVAHRDGHSEENSLSAPLDTSGSKSSNVIQALGSSVTYLSRYTLKSALGLAASVDDDGAAVQKLDSDQLEFIWETARNRYPDDADGELAKAWVSRLAMAFFAETITDVPADRFDDIKLKIKAQADAEARRKQAKS